MVDDKKSLCPDCEKEISQTPGEWDGYCPHCQFPVRFNDATTRVEALKQRRAAEAEKEKEKEKPTKRKSPFGGVL